MRVLIVLILFSAILSILIYKLALINFSINSKDFNKILKQNKLNSISSIVESTPYLWRTFTFNKNETVRTRVNAQVNWIKNIAKTDYVRESPLKNILVQDGLRKLYYRTDGRIKCPYAVEFEKKCNLIEDDPEEKGVIVELLWSKYNMVDAVVSVRNWETREIEKIPSGIQQIMYILENPSIAKSALLGMNNALLASYWRGSDILIPYTLWVPNETLDVSITTDKPEIGVIFNKTKLVVAAISNCDSTTNLRMEYIKELQKYIQVDIYGKCGTMTCGSRTSHKENVDCFQKFGEQYKFYLSFENSNCVDYITEKFFRNALQNSLLPVVMGAEKENYNTAAPPHSFIHVDDFESPKALADYLHLLDKNNQLYNEYFEWKGTGYLKSEFDDFFCKVCGMLFYADFIPPPKWNSTETTWNDVNKCK